MLCIFRCNVSTKTKPSRFERDLRKNTSKENFVLDLHLVVLVFVMNQPLVRYTYSKCVGCTFIKHYNSIDEVVSHYASYFNSKANLTSFKLCMIDCPFNTKLTLS